MLHIADDTYLIRQIHIDDLGLHAAA